MPASKNTASAALSVLVAVLGRAAAAAAPRPRDLPGAEKAVVDGVDTVIRSWP